MEQKIKEIYDFLCSDGYLNVLDEKYKDYIDKIYFEIFNGDRTFPNNIAWFVTVSGIIIFECANLINKTDSANKYNLINEYFESIPDRKEEIIQLGKSVDKYSDMIYKKKKNDFDTTGHDISYYEDDIIML